MNNNNYSKKDINSSIVWTAIITPMLSDGKIDFDSLEGLLKEQEAAGNGILLLGSTGEALNIDEDEKKQILDFGLSLGLNSPLMCGVGGINLNSQRKWIRYLNGLKLDAYLLVVPLYAKPGVIGQYEWFKSLLNESDKPCMVYNVPGRTGKKLEEESLRKISRHPNFWAVKEASGSEDQFKRYKEAAPNAHMMSGDDPMLPFFAKHGAKGVVSVASNVWPQETKEFARQCLSGELKDLELWQTAAKSLFVASNPVPVKSILTDLGRISSNKTRPPLSEKDMPGLDSVRAANQAVADWFNRQQNAN